MIFVYYEYFPIAIKFFYNYVYYHSLMNVPKCINLTPNNAVLNFLTHKSLQTF